MRNILLIIIVFLSFQLFSQKRNKKASYFSDPERMHFVPGGNYVSDKDSMGKIISVNAFWMGELVTKNEYNNFINNIKENLQDSLFIIDYQILDSISGGPEAMRYYSYENILPELSDSSLWRSSQRNDQPILGVSFRQAQFYCAWLTKIENKELANRHIEGQVLFRLPSEEEWVYVQSLLKNGAYDKRSNARGRRRKSIGFLAFDHGITEWTISHTQGFRAVLCGKETGSIATENSSIYKSGFRAVSTYLR
ncbi:MAG: SUMF1/EgtB/PvdO family nonheme iron enzyme [Bacteroidales bacterium]|nr:SUMF1/EgtB/PvdO family nonheme iron enzyme [Bacteroidales bacterium]